MKAILLSVALFAAIPASAVTVVTFDAQPAPTEYTGGFSFIDSGYIFTAGQNLSYVWDANSPNSNGTNNLIAGFGGDWTITKQGGGAFTLVSLDLAISWYSRSTAETTTVGSAPVNYTTTLSTYVVNQTGTSISIVGTPTDGYWTADNFVFDGAVVPEPATWAMLIAGFGLVGFAARRRRETSVSA